MTIAPTIETPRLRLRHHRIEDFDPMYALFVSERSGYMGGPENTRSIKMANRMGAYHDPQAELHEGKTVSETSVYRHDPDVLGKIK